MMKRKEFMLGAIAGLTFAAAATAGGVIDWPSANAGPVAGFTGRLAPNAGGSGLAFAPPQGAPLSFADIFEQVAPAVVQIEVRTRVAQRQRFIQVPGLGAVPDPRPAPEGEEGEDGESATALGAGSGFFIAANGYIVTNNHVVADATEIRVKLADGREMDARLIGRDENTDLAVIKVEGTDFPFVNFEEAAQPRVGDWVIAVGNPFGLGGTATAGIVSAQGRRDIDSAYVDYLQIDAAINQGNSGGPTFDIYGRVIGVNAAIFSQTGGSVGIGFAIPASVAKPITDRLMRGETIERGYVGVGIQNLGRDQIEAQGLPADFTGAWVGEVTSGGPAEAGGVQIGDIVTQMNGTPVRDRTDLTRRIGQVRPGETIRLEVLRDGRRQALSIRVRVRPPESELNTRLGQEQGGPPVVEGAGVSVGGLTVAPMSEALRRRYSIPAAIDGLVVTTAETVGELNFRPGYVITRSAAGPVRTPADFEAAIAAARRANRAGVYLVVWTPQGHTPIVLPLPKPE